jgi:hypothetical protein
LAAVKNLPEEQRKMEKTGPAKELGSVSDFFISTPKEGRTSSPPVSNLKAWSNPKENCEVEESVTARKRIAYPNTRSAQEDMKKNFSMLLQEGYMISRIEVKRTSEKVKPGSRTITSEEIAMFVK